MSNAAAYRASMTEVELMDAIIEAAQRSGYLVMHIPDKLYKLAGKERRHDAMVGAKGFPDVFLLRGRDGKRLMIECKTERGSVTDEQIAWLDASVQCGIPAIVARPSDLDMILEMLK